MKFIASIWPKEHLEVLAPRAALLVEGAAFHKVMRISPEKLKTNSVDGVITLVETLGGSWGMTMLEEQYETFERALYGTLQKSDESHDSYVARSEVHFEELLARGTTLEEIRAYVLLRQSTLSPDDRKKIVLDQGGKLRYPEVTKAFRLLGSRFFQDLQGNKSSKTKVYDVNLTECDSEPAFAASHDAESGVSHPASSTEALTFLTALDDEVDGDYIEALVAQNDEDACAVQQFEQELEEFLQDTPSMHDALVTYIDARQKLQDKRKTRGFWPVQSSSNPYSKGGKKGKAAKGGGKGKKRVNSSWHGSLDHIVELAVNADTGGLSVQIVPTQAPLRPVRVRTWLKHLLTQAFHHFWKAFRIQLKMFWKCFPMPLRPVSIDQPISRALLKGVR